MAIKARALGAITLSVILPFSISSSALANPAAPFSELDTLGSAQSNETISEGLSAEANAAERDNSGTLLSVTWSIENNGGDSAYFDWPTGNSYMYENTPFSGITAISQENDKRFHPIMDGEGSCLCSGISSIDIKDKIEPGEKVAYWSMFSVPSDVDTITLEIPGFDPIEDIPIS
ncbi:hypothetical protein ABZ644_06930 [Nocardiopsis alba]|jgi:hypothetical protein|uniref:hypothetical protein n=1 Tax=Nocardiopsis alba TaxID=53437 RepID=UPI0033F692C4